MFWQISATIHFSRFIAFFFSSFDHRTFGEVATVVYTLYAVVLSSNLKQKRLIHCYAYSRKEIFKCTDWRVMRWVEEWTKAWAWGFPYHPKKYPRSTSVKAWGCPRGTPSSSAKIRSQDTIFLLLHALCVFLGASIVLVFSISLV
jgi:hypothetical protein